MPKAKTFRATLERMSSRLLWVIVQIPFDVGKTWGKRGHVRVKGEINGFAFRSAVFPTRSGRHFLNINKKMQAGSGARAGSVARFRLEPDTAVRTITLPREFEREISQDKALRRYFDSSLNFSTRKAIADWIGEAKSPETRRRRAEQLALRLYETMEAEQELPPQLRIMFGRIPGALKGWDGMSPTQRRAQLLSIFYYRDPESRLRRMEKAAQAAAARVRKSE